MFLTIEPRLRRVGVTSSGTNSINGKRMPQISDTKGSLWASCLIHLHPNQTNWTPRPPMTCRRNNEKPQSDNKEDPDNNDIVLLCSAWFRFLSPATTAPPLVSLHFNITSTRRTMRTRRNQPLHYRWVVIPGHAARHRT